PVDMTLDRPSYNEAAFLGYENRSDDRGRDVGSNKHIRSSNRHNKNSNRNVIYDDNHQQMHINQGTGQNSLYYPAPQTNYSYHQQPLVSQPQPTALDLSDLNLDQHYINPYNNQESAYQYYSQPNKNYSKYGTPQQAPSTPLNLSQMNLASNELYNADISYMNNYLKSLPDYSILSNQNINNCNNDESESYNYTNYTSPLVAIIKLSAKQKMNYKNTINRYKTNIASLNSEIMKNEEANENPFKLRKNYSYTNVESQIRENLLREELFRVMYPDQVQNYMQQSASNTAGFYSHINSTFTP
ncbi:unnamed protein product, partial [Sphagnum compactum]